MTPFLYLYNHECKLISFTMCSFICQWYYFQQRKLLMDESWIINPDNILRGKSCDDIEQISHFLFIHSADSEFRGKFKIGN